MCVGVEGRIGWADLTPRMVAHEDNSAGSESIGQDDTVKRTVVHLVVILLRLRADYLSFY